MKTIQLCTIDGTPHLQQELRAASPSSRFGQLQQSAACGVVSAAGADGLGTERGGFFRQFDSVCKWTILCQLMGFYMYIYIYMMNLINMVITNV